MTPSLHPVLRLGDHDDPSWWEFPHLSGCPELRHGFFTRLGGYSTGPYAGLNVGDHVGDASAAVVKNRKAVADALGFDDLFPVRQVHGADILIIKENDGPFHQDAPPEADAIICNRPGIGLLIQTADCQAVMLFDPGRRVIANVHAGWRGTVGNIVGKTLATMEAVFKCSPRDILAGVGPSLGPCCAEFVHYRTEIPEMYWPYKDDRNRFDLWAISRDQMLASGIKAGNIAIAGSCTRCDPDRFFSYRASKITGRLAAVIGMVL